MLVGFVYPCVCGVCACVLSHSSHFRLFAILWTAASQVPLSMGFTRQEYWSGLPRPLQGDLPNPGIEVGSLALQAQSLLLIHWESLSVEYIQLNIQHCSTIIKFNTYMNTRNTITGFCSQVWPHLAWPFSPGIL